MLTVTVARRALGVARHGVPCPAAQAAWRSRAGRAVHVRAEAAPIHIVAISGSLRKGSTNTGLLRAALKSLPAGVTMEIVPLNGIPTYDDDLWQGGADESVLPQPIRTFRTAVLKADALLFACPEYNGTLTSPLKAAIDWGYCGRGPNVFDDKAAGIIGAGGGAGTARAQYALRLCGANMNVHWVNGQDVIIKRFEMPGGFDDATGDLLDARTTGYVQAKVAELAGLARRLKH